MPFDVGQFLTNLSSPDLRDALNAQKEQQRQLLKDRKTDEGFLIGSGVADKDSLAHWSTGQIQQAAAAQRAKLAVGARTLADTQQRLQNEAMQRQADAQAAMSDVFQSAQAEQAQAMQPGPQGEPISTDQSNLGPVAPLPAQPTTFDVMGSPMATQTGTSAPEFDMGAAIARGFMRNPKALLTPFGAQFMQHLADPNLKRKLGLEALRLDIEGKRANLYGRQVETEAGAQKLKEDELKLRTWDTEPDDETKADLYDAGMAVIPTSDGKFRSVSIHNVTEPRPDIGAQLAAATGVQLAPTVQAQKPNPFRKAKDLKTSGAATATRAKERAALANELARKNPTWTRAQIIAEVNKQLK